MAKSGHERLIESVREEISPSDYESAALTVELQGHNDLAVGVIVAESVVHWRVGPQTITLTSVSS